MSGLMNLLDSPIGGCKGVYIYIYIMMVVVGEFVLGEGQPVRAQAWFPQKSVGT